MKLLHDTYLEQMNEELEIINYKLERLHEAAFGSDPRQEDAISLLSESSSDEDDIVPINEEAYQAYMEAAGSSLGAIWRAIVRFIKSIFVSSGEKITAAEAKKVIEIVESASSDGKVQNVDKKVVQKAFYMLAGLSRSSDGVAMSEAYRDGKIYEYVMKNIKKLSIGGIRDDAEFRICVGAYDETMSVNFGTIKTVFDVVSKGGFDALKTESVETEAMTEAKAKITTMRTAKQDGLIKAAIVAAGLSVAAGVGFGIHKIVTSKTKSPKNITFATITFVNETKEDAIAKVRLFVGNNATDITIKGRDKVYKMRDNMTEIADKMGTTAAKLDNAKAKQDMMDVSETINRFFAGLTSR